MSVSRLPSGKWRAQVYDVEQHKVVSAASVLKLRERTFASETLAREAVVDARRRLRAQAGDSGVTVRDWWERWTSDALFSRPKQSTNMNYRTGTQVFVRRYGSLKMAEVDDQVVSAWLTGGLHNWTVPQLRAMFADAMRPTAGRLVDRNPFSRLGISAPKGNRDVDPPSEELVWRMIAAADWPGFAGWLQVACFSGLRPGELDALRWSDVDLEGGVLHVRRTFSSSARVFTRPKNGRTRKVAILPQAREALVRMPAFSGDSEFVFVNPSGGHWRPTARQHHWEKVRSATGWSRSLYLATRHFAGWFLYEQCRIGAEDVASMLGHRDGGKLVRELYGHHSADAALDRIRLAVEGRERFQPGEEKAA